MPTNLEVNTDYTSAQRFPAWIALTVFSAICLAGVESQYPNNNPNAGYKWSLACTIISMVLSFISVLFYLLARHLFIATPLEIGMAGFLLIIWGAGFAVIMNPNRGIAVSTENVNNANLYFGAWAALIAIVYIAGSLAQDVTGVSVRDVAPAKAGRWYALTATSIVVWSSSVRIFVADSCGNQYLNHLENCKRTKFAISAGVISTLASVIMAYAVQKGLLGHLLEFGITSFLFIFWCFGVGLITFGFSPGSHIGNLFFATWISFLLIVTIFSQSFQTFLAQFQDPAPATENQTNGEHEPDVIVDDM